MENRCLARYDPRESSLQRINPVQGFSLVEMLVVVVILGILASVAVPFGEIVTRRTKEIELRRALRTIRNRIDRFHQDWEEGRILKSGEGVSEYGFPKTLEVLVNGVDTGASDKSLRKYLRSIPGDPFGDPESYPEDTWALRGYQDKVETLFWNRKDVWDIHSKSEKTAINGTKYNEW